MLGSSKLRIRRGPSASPFRSSPSREEEEVLPTVEGTDLPSSRRRQKSRTRRFYSSRWNYASRCPHIFWFIGSLLLTLLLLHFLFKPFSTRRIDHFLTFIVMRRVFQKRHEYLKSLHIDDIPPTQIRYANDIHTHAAMTELLLRRQRRTQTLRDLELRRQKGATISSTSRVIFVPAIFGYEYPRPGQFPNYTRLLFDDAVERQELIATTLEPLQPLSHNPDLFALCAVYQYGGAYVGSHVPEIVHSPDQQQPSLVVTQQEEITDRRKSWRIHTLFAPLPHHPILKCILMNIQLSDGLFLQFVDDSILDLARTDTATVLALESAKSCHFRRVDSPVVDSSYPSDTLTIKVIEIPSTNATSKSTTRLQSLVEIRSTENRPWTKVRKQSLQTQMKVQGAEPGWMCNRCLNWALAGNLQTCRTWCPRGYEHIICGLPKQTTAETDILVTQSMKADKRIPRIIHQTWFDRVTFDRYPQLARLQMTWKMTGWDYRFYTDDDARRYIIQHYPKPFVEAFDSLIHGAYKADLFRYLVLLREGGIYADIDVKLEATALDAFVTPSLSFFAPRDIPCEYADGAYCLWNGFVGASPGNPILVRAVERLVNLIAMRADIYAMERELCVKNNNTFPIWKARAQPLLLLTGPCGLGIAFNEALGRPSLNTLELGMIGMDQLKGRDHGDALILLGDKYDMNEFRITDPERNLIVASTDIQNLEATPRRMEEGEIVPQPGPHYSDSKRGVTIWGSANVYTDDLATDERVRLNVEYNTL